MNTMHRWALETQLDLAPIGSQLEVEMTVDGTAYTRGSYLKVEEGYMWLGGDDPLDDLDFRLQPTRVPKDFFSREDLVTAYRTAHLSIRWLNI